MCKIIPISTRPFRVVATGHPSAFNVLNVHVTALHSHTRSSRSRCGSTGAAPASAPVVRRTERTHIRTPDSSFAHVLFRLFVVGPTTVRVERRLTHMAAPLNPESAPTRTPSSMYTPFLAESLGPRVASFWYRHPLLRSGLGWLAICPIAHSVVLPIASKHARTHREAPHRMHHTASHAPLTHRTARTLHGRLWCASPRTRLTGHSRGSA